MANAGAKKTTEGCGVRARYGVRFTEVKCLYRGYAETGRQFTIRLAKRKKRKSGKQGLGAIRDIFDAAQAAAGYAQWRHSCCRAHRLYVAGCRRDDACATCEWRGTGVDSRSPGKWPFLPAPEAVGISDNGASRAGRVSQRTYDRGQDCH